MRRTSLLLASLLLNFCAIAQTPEAQVSAVLDALHQAAAEGDYDAYIDLYAPEAVFLGTDAWERWDRPAFEAFAQPRFGDGGGWTYESTERHVFVSPNGETAWFDEMLQNANLGTTRGSGVLLKLDGNWKVAQYNLSMPVPNEYVRDLAERIRVRDAALAAPTNDIAALVDSIAAALVDSGRVAGLSVGVISSGDTLVLKGYGLADLEYGIETPAHAVYEIASITKQFTAAGVLRLAERGEIDLDADVTAYLPAFNTQGRAIPVSHLLTHTSGIQGYTEMEVFGSLTVQDLPRDTLVTLMGSWPLWHEPGEQMIYNNSAYFLSGLIIEKVSGQSYEDFLETEFFGPLGMEDSRYCSNSAIVPRRTRGYGFRPGGLVRADYLNHLWPYAAGSICSSVEDLLTWNAALHGGQVLGDEAYAQLIAPGRLNDGTPTRYAAGLTRVRPFGRDAIAHGGGINGFLSDAVVFPGEETTIVVLINTAGPASPAGVTAQIARSLFGAYQAPSQPVDLDETALAGEWTGPDRGGAAAYFLEKGDDGWTFRRGDRNGTPLLYEGNGWFTSPDGNGLRVGLKEAADGSPRLHVDTAYGYSVLERAGR